jgi:hypothetical protein
MTIVAEFKASPEYIGSTAIPSKYNKAFAIGEEPKRNAEHEPDASTSIRASYRSARCFSR